MVLAEDFWYHAGPYVLKSVQSHSLISASDLNRFWWVEKVKPQYSVFLKLKIRNNTFPHRINEIYCLSWLRKIYICITIPSAKRKNTIFSIPSQTEVCVCVFYCTYECVSNDRKWSSSSLTACDGCQTGDPSVRLAAGLSDFSLGRIDLFCMRVCVCVWTWERSTSVCVCRNGVTKHYLSYFLPFLSELSLYCSSRKTKDEDMMQKNTDCTKV